MAAQAGLFYFVSVNCNAYNYLFMATLFTYTEDIARASYCVVDYISYNIIVM